MHGANAVGTSREIALVEEKRHKVPYTTDTKFYEQMYGPSEMYCIVGSKQSKCLLRLVQGLCNIRKFVITTRILV